MLAFVQLSDVHICDHQSPMRFESQDPNISSSAYRPQEMLSAHIAESMVREINAIATGPVTGLPLAHAVQTGDNSDNGQYNEIRWNIDILDGGEVRPDSGDLTKYEGVMDVDWDPDKSTYANYWHPEIAGRGRQQVRRPSRPSRACSTPPASPSRRRASTSSGTPRWATTTRWCRATS